MRIYNHFARLLIAAVLAVFGNTCSLPATAQSGQPQPPALQTAPQPHSQFYVTFTPGASSPLTGAWVRNNTFPMLSEGHTSYKMGLTLGDDNGVQLRSNGSVVHPENVGTWSVNNDQLTISLTTPAQWTRTYRWRITNPGQQLVLTDVLAPEVGDIVFDKTRYISNNLDLPSSSTYAAATGVNNKGQAVGRAGGYTSGAFKGFRWQPGVGTSTFGTLGGRDSWANAINDIGISSGWTSRSTDIAYSGAAAIWFGNNPTPTPIGTLGFEHSYAYEINNSNEVIGWVSHGDYDAYRNLAFLWTQSSGMKSLGTLGGFSSAAFCINNKGQVVGGADTTANNGWRPYLWTPTTPNGFVGNMIPLEPSQEHIGVAVNISDDGKVIGSIFINGLSRAFLWTPNTPNAATGTMRQLYLPDGYANSEATGVNNRGDVVGDCYNKDADGNFTMRRAFLWTKVSGLVFMDQLASAQPGFGYVENINNLGQIVGWSGANAVLLTPNPKVALFVHGTWSNGKRWNNFRNSLAGTGMLSEAMDFPTEMETQSNEAAIEDQARALGRRIHEFLNERTGEQWVSLVCHSMGGLAARYYLKHPELWQVTDDIGNLYSGVAKVVMLGTPNWGTDGMLLDPVGTLAGAVFGAKPYAVDKHRDWSPALKEMFAEWQPPSSIGTYARNDYKLGKWPQSSGQYVSPMTLASYAASDFAFTWAGLNYPPLQQVETQTSLLLARAEFPPVPARIRQATHPRYYEQMANSMGVLRSYMSPAIDGVNARRISSFLWELNNGDSETIGVHVYLAAGLDPTVFAFEIKIPGPFNTNDDAGLGKVFNDGVVPTNSALAYDPVLNRQLFPGAVMCIFSTYHTNLPDYPAIVNQTISWLKE